MQLLLHFILALYNSSVSSQIIYSTSRQVPFPSWLICLGYHRHFNESWPCGWSILEEITEDLCYNLYSATKMGDLGQISCSSAILFLSCLSCKIFAISETLLKGQIFKCLWKLNSANPLETGGLHQESPPGPLYYWVAELPGRWMFCCMGLQINRHD